MTYNEFIQNIINTRGQWNISDGEYWEGHHIIPRCKGGEGNSKTKHNNIIWLYAKEHYIAHKLLAEENPNDWDLVNAFHCIAHMGANSNKRYISEDEYDIARKYMSECIKNSYPYTIECVETGELFKCPSDIKLKYPNIHTNHVGLCCRGERITTGGYHWRYFNCDKYELKKDKTRIKDLGPIRCIETGETFDTLNDIPNISKVIMYKVYDCCIGKQCTTISKHWEFVNNSMNISHREDRRKYGRLNWSDNSKEHFKLSQQAARAKWDISTREKEKLRKSKESGSHRWFNNGEINTFCDPKNKPEGFKPGRCNFKRNTHEDI